MGAGVKQRKQARGKNSLDVVIFDEVAEMRRNAPISHEKLTRLLRDCPGSDKGIALRSLTELRKAAERAYPCYIVQWEHCGMITAQHNPKTKGTEFSLSPPGPDIAEHMDRFADNLRERDRRVHLRHLPSKRFFRMGILTPDERKRLRQAMR